MSIAVDLRSRTAFGLPRIRFLKSRKLAIEYFIFDMFSIFFQGYCGILWGPTQGLTTDTFEVSSTATAQTVN